jgi:hypothetical protein
VSRIIIEEFGAQDVAAVERVIGNSSFAKLPSSFA